MISGLLSKRLWSLTRLGLDGKHIQVSAYNGVMKHACGKGTSCLLMCLGLFWHGSQKYKELEWSQHPTIPDSCGQVSSYCEKKESEFFAIASLASMGNAFGFYFCMYFKQDN